MSEAKHTPGPWSRDKYGPILSGGGSDVMFRSLTILASSSSERIAEAEANTTLAAAAPCMLAALREAQIALGLMLSYHGQGSSDYADVAQVRADDAINIVGSAIAKAVQS